jgi:hypothetical protein
MTLVRTALRLATINALRGANAASGPTIARNRVYDSRISDLAPESFSDDAKPSIIVLTDDDEGDALSDQNGGPPFRRLVNLVIEFGMVQRQEVKYEEDGVTKTAIVVGAPATDAEHESFLDLLEFQITSRLAYDPAEACFLWRQLARVWKEDCHRQTMEDSGVKLAARILTWQCEITDDTVDVRNADVDDVPTGLGLLPEPLRTVALALPSDSEERAVCDAIAAAIAPLSVPALEGVDMRIAVGDQEEDDLMDVSIEVVSAQDMPQVVATGGPVVIDYAKGTLQNLILAANVTAISIINWPRHAKTGRIILKVTQVGAFNITPTAWPAGTLWVAGDEPSISQGAGKVDLLALVSGNAGAEIFGNIIGQDYQA